MDLDLGCVAAFLVLLEEQHYGRAAARMHLTSPALTKRIQRLEHQLGVPLLERGAAGVVGATSAGLRFARAAGPLLERAAAARRSASDVPAVRTVRLGVPGQLGEFPDRGQLAAVGVELRRQCPEVRLLCSGLAFTELTSALVAGGVDVVLTATRNTHRDVVTTPLSPVARVGVVSEHHELAQVGTADAGAFSELPMLHHPAVPAEWMAPWLLADLRPLRTARLVEVRTADVSGVLHRVALGREVATMQAPLALRLPPGVRAVVLTGAPEVVLTATHRRSDRRESVLSLVRALRTVGSEPAVLVGNGTVRRS